ncbi:thiamine pyrophosphate-dependent enzyme [Micromonospora sp. NPDC048830]|uniref:thiamine pyrophosphate-dependent enzyme n=1 Tax=Micromonospora sp. NPDC048830 TaxID=3364257 RepID=UPI003723B052
MCPGEWQIPTAMGVKLAIGNAEAWAIDGGGSFQVTQQKLATCVAERVPIKVALINNDSFGMVWQR